MRREEKAKKARIPVSRSLGGIGLVGGLVWSALWLQEEIRTSPRFAVSQIEVDGQVHARPEALRALAAVSMGTNIFSVDLSQVRQRVGAHPWVAQAEVRRRLPRSLRVRIREHRPVALVRGATLHFVDRQGGFIKIYEPGDPADLPVISFQDGPDSNAEVSIDWRDRGLTAALTSLHRWSQSPLPVLSEVRVAPSGRLALRTVDGWRVHVAPPLRSRSLRRLQVLRNELNGPHQVFLEGTRRPDQVVVAEEGGTDA